MSVSARYPRSYHGAGSDKSLAVPPNVCTIRPNIGDPQNRRKPISQPLVAEAKDHRVRPNPHENRHGTTQQRLRES